MAKKPLLRTANTNELETSSHYINPDEIWQNDYDDNDEHTYQAVRAFIYDGETDKLFTDKFPSTTHYDLIRSNLKYFRTAHNNIYGGSSFDASDDDSDDTDVRFLRLLSLAPNRFIFGRSGITKDGKLYVSLWADNDNYLVSRMVDQLLNICYGNKIRESDVVIHRPSGSAPLKQDIKFYKDKADRAKEQEMLHLMQPSEKQKKLKELGATSRQNFWRKEAQKVGYQEPWRWTSESVARNKYL